MYFIMQNSPSLKEAFDLKPQKSDDYQIISNLPGSYKANISEERKRKE